jgi:putative salt-induced outer membrane protein YdiY
LYKSVNNKVKTDLYDVYGKVNYNLPDNRNYLQVAIRFQHDPSNNSRYHDIVVVGIGHGYRVIHTDAINISVESSIAQAESIEDSDDIPRLNQTILRESIWASYKMGHKSSISNKLLIEEGGTIHYIKNLLVIQYELDHGVYINLTHTWIQDVVNRNLVNVTSVNLGVKF